VDNTQSLRAALLNVVLNAVEAAGSGGRVRLWIDQADSHVCVHVADSGNGPPESVRGTMFEPFVTSKPEGVGLGLVLAKATATEHGGEVSWSRIGGETVFTISLLAKPRSVVWVDPIPSEETRPSEVARSQ
jgi:C4-dicarboxylate-specific signal transduction histidine kinase